LNLYILSDAGNVPLLSTVVQFPKNIETQTHPSLISFKISEIRASLDPLFFEWLEYCATYHKLGSVHILHSDSQQLITEATSSDTGTRKKTFPSLHESVHSSSDKEKKRSAVTEKSKTLRNDETQKKSEFKTEGEQQVLKLFAVIVRSYVIVVNYDTAIDCLLMQKSFLTQYGTYCILKIEINDLEFTEIRDIGQISRIIFLVVQSCAKWSDRTYYHLYTI